MIFQKFLDAIRRVIRKMFGSKNKIEDVVGRDVAVSDKMAQRIDLWTEIYENRAPWLNKNVRSTGNAAAVAKELARLATVEFKSEIKENDFLNKEYQSFLENFREYVEYAVAKGGIAFKPYLSNGHIEVDVVQAENFYPVKFNSRKEVIAAALPEEITEGEYIYTRIEYHELTQAGEMILNKAYRKRFDDRSDGFGKEITLDSVEEWAQLQPEALVKGIDRTLFVYFKMPDANNVDSGSPIGMSAFDRALGDLKDADEQWARAMWEYEGSELAIDADETMFRKDEETGELQMPHGKDRLFRTMDFAGIDIDAKDGYHVFSPDIRDESLFNGYNKILRNIEFKCGLAYGTLSDPQNVDKTAEEIKASKQRSHSTVKDIQNAAEKSLEHLIYAMNVWARLGKLSGSGKYETTYEWDDSIIEDKAAERQQDRQDVSMGVMAHWEYRAKWYNEDEATAKANIPEQNQVME